MRFVQVQLCAKANPAITDCGAQAAKTTNRTMPSDLEMLLRESAHGHDDNKNALSSMAFVHGLGLDDCLNAMPILEEVWHGRVRQ